jgi:hypothetical protein
VDFQKIYDIIHLNIFDNFRRKFMKKFVKTFLVALLIIPCVLGLSACSLFSGGDENTDGDGTGGATKETIMEITGDIPFSLGNDFYFYVESKPIVGALNPEFYSFTAMRLGTSIYSNYTYIKYQNYANYTSDTFKDKYIEERTMIEGEGIVDYRRSSYSNDANTLPVYEETWNTTVPNGTTMTTTIQYIQNFLNGNHTADTPYKNGVAQTSKIDSKLSNYIHTKNAGGYQNNEIYADGTENITFDRVEIENPNLDFYYQTDADTANVTKYKGNSTYFESSVVNIKVWGNIVVSATPVSGQTVYKRIISSKFSDEVPQQVFETIFPESEWV